MRPRPLLFVVVLTIIVVGVIWFNYQSPFSEPHKTASVVADSSLTPQPRAPLPPTTLYVDSTTSPPEKNPNGADSIAASQKTELKKNYPIHFADGPADGSERVLAKVLTLAKILKISTDNSAILNTRPPLAWYRMQERTDELNTLTPIGYLYFVENNGEIVAIARINNASGSVSPVGAATVNEIERAEIISRLATLDDVKNGSYEVRLLSVPRPDGDRGSDVIWLKADSGGTDLFYPLPISNINLSIPYGLQAGTLYKAEDFLKIIHSLQPTN